MKKNNAVSKTANSCVALISFSICLLTTSSAAADCILGEENIVNHTEENGLSYFENFGSSGYALVQEITRAETVDVFNVSGSIELGSGQNIIKSNLVTFSEGGLLKFMDVEAPVWAIIAEDFRVHGRSGVKTGIFRNPDYTLEKRLARDTGDRGKSYSENTRHASSHGADGGRGNDGMRGELGESRNLPCLIVITRNVEFSEQSSPQYFTVDLSGIRGGDGGDGGNGGDGGDGQAGNHAEYKGLNCRNEAGDGGSGGDGGTGGDAGHGGRGGNGGSIIFIGIEEHGRRFLSSQVFQEPGEPGQPGSAGLGGSFGQGGDDGSREGFCLRNAVVGELGKPGLVGNPGSVGENGIRGRSQIISVLDRHIDEIMNEMLPSQ